MTQESAVQFAPNSRIHFGLAVKDLHRSVGFYRILLGQDPTKIRPHYTKFEVPEPPVNLALNEVDGESGPNNSVAHFGIQVKSTAAVKAVSCCHFELDQRGNVIDYIPRPDRTVCKNCDGF